VTGAVSIRPARPEDGSGIAALYAPYVEASAISLEDRAPTGEEMAARIAAGGSLHPWLVAEAEEGVVGFASASQFRPRLGYRFTVETSVYVAAERHGNGIGRALYEALFDLLVAQGFTQAIAAITLPNEASVKLHEAFGFERCGVYRQVGWKLGRWWDVGLWQRALAPVVTPPAEVRPFEQLRPIG
jgi:L-amino acid N-acyltransferase YncA